MLGISVLLVVSFDQQLRGRILVLQKQNIRTCGDQENGTLSAISFETHALDSRATVNLFASLSQILSKGLVEKSKG
jgi:hypothetical protein